ncbi:MAG: alpha/beta hydrolase [Acidobacteria bacterium]|nr:alpha/beta hydrolase [Acidobacteriota bacterium]
MDARNGWATGPYHLPVPAGASDVLADSIRNTPAPDIDANRQLIPRSEAEWLALVKEADKEKRAIARQLADQFSVTVKEEQIGGVGTHRVTPPEIDPRHQDHLFVYIHGGAYVLNAGEAGLGEAIVIAAGSKMPVLSIDYRMPPQHPFPAGLDDVIAVWEHLLTIHPADSTAMGGSSAGSGLILAVVHKLIGAGHPTPGALYAGTPWTDLTKTGDSYYTNEGVDRMLVTYDGILASAARLYAGSHDLTEPLISPIYGDFTGFPPTFLVTGTRDLFLSNTIRVHTKLRAAGVTADLLVFEGVSHGEYGFEATSPETLLTYSELDKFLLQHL